MELQKNFNIKKSTRLSVVFTIASLLFASSIALAQNSAQKYDNKTARKFARVLYNTITVQEQSKNFAATEIMTTGLEIEQIEPMMQAYNNGDSTFGGASLEDQRAMKYALKKIAEQQKKIKKVLTIAINQTGLDSTKIDEMAKVYQSDATFKARIDSLLIDIDKPYKNRYGRSKRWDLD